MSELADAFRVAAGDKLRLTRADVTTTDAGQVLTLAGWRKSGHAFYYQSEPYQGEAPVDALVRHILGEDPLKAHLEAQTQRIKLAQSVAREIVDGRKRGANGMGKLQSVAERIKATKDKLDAEADKLAARLDTVDAKAPLAFDRGHSFLDSQDADLSAMEEELRQLSNLPLPLGG